MVVWDNHGLDHGRNQKNLLTMVIELTMVKLKSIVENHGYVINHGIITIDHGYMMVSPKQLWLDHG